MGHSFPRGPGGHGCRGSRRSRGTRARAVTAPPVRGREILAAGHRRVARRFRGNASPDTAAGRAPHRVPRALGPCSGGLRLRN